MEQKCLVCGKPIKPGVLGKVRKNAKYCSEECRIKARNEYVRNYCAIRGASDKEWADKRREANKEYQKIYRANRRVEIMENACEALSTMTDKKEIEGYLNEHFKLKIS